MSSPADLPSPVDQPFRAKEVERVVGDSCIPAMDLLAVEEPLEIRITYVLRGRRRQRSISVTMRTPGNDRELAAGFLFTEGIVTSRRDILAIMPCRNGNRIRVHLRDNVDIDPRKLKRNFYTTSSCGVCGQSSIDAIRVCMTHTPEKFFPTVPASVIPQLPVKLREAQAVFEQTGGLHACALFDSTGNLLSIREDVGRHNALDKLIGHHLLANRVPIQGSILLVSSRASFELVQKAAVAGIPILAAVGAPSSLAVELAQEQGMTLLGFVRQNRFNIYCGRERVSGLTGNT
ncbi:formate dehydrogenase accessory sulfurtransferase FdhD [Planctomicrobium sp. SH661]|uniref:formate dehydrogenase accessory sulfurtransferase FdhD n=1 Tax=Planctomicrobium sp. SH661 TaxID=3448124 RepID=UPI003F5B09B4